MTPTLNRTGVALSKKIAISTFISLASVSAIFLLLLTDIPFYAAADTPTDAADHSVKTQPANQPAPVNAQTQVQPANIQPQVKTQPAIQPPPVQTSPSLPVQPLNKPEPAKTVTQKGQVSFNFDDADVFSVIQTIFGDILKVNYIIDPRVTGKVNFRSVAPVPKEDVLPLMQVILRLNGIAIAEEGGLYRIIPISDISKEPTAVGIGRESDKVILTGKALLQVIPVRYIQSSELVRVLTPFLSANALMVDVPKSNHVIIADTDVNIKRLLQLVEIFDSEKLKQVTPQVFVYPVQNSKAKDVASILQQIFLSTKTPAQTSQTPAATPSKQPPPTPTPMPSPAGQPQVTVVHGGGDSLVSDITRIFPDEVTNSIIILATPEDYKLISEAVQKIDIVPRQVMIEALIVEVTLDDDLTFGLAWSLRTKAGFSTNPFSNTFNLSGDVGFNTTNLKADMSAGTSGFSFLAADSAGIVRGLLESLATDNKLKVLASPHVLALDNREARIQIGSQVPILTSVTTASAATTGTTLVPTQTSTVQYKDTGIILKVKPQINESGIVTMEISQEVSSADTITLQGYGQEVVINKREVTTNLVAQDGQTIVIGGLIKDQNSNNRSGLPLLSKIPLFGWLFGSTEKKDQRTELIVLLTPHVIRNQTEAGNISSGYMKRLKDSRQEIETKKSEMNMIDSGNPATH